MENMNSCLQAFQPLCVLRARNVPPPAGYHYKMKRRLFLSKITFISLVSLTSVAVWSHTSTLTGKSHQLQNLGNTSPSPWAPSVLPPALPCPQPANASLCHGVQFGMRGTSRYAPSPPPHHNPLCMTVLDHLFFFPTVDQKPWALRFSPVPHEL